jgi:lipoyl(octanoyl) transferase
MKINPCSSNPILPTNVELPSRRICEVYECGIVPYRLAWEWQKQWVQERLVQPQLPDALFLLEHPSVYTLGQGATLDHVRFDLKSPTIEIHRTERGGEVTHHTPGQLVGYPILNLNFYQRDLHWYLRQLEEVILRVLAHYELEGYRMDGLTGVWAEGHKVAAIGIKVSRWITMHGFALNVCPDLSGFDRIIPCGISNHPVGALEQFIPGIQVHSVQEIVKQAFAKIFEVQLLEGQLPLQIPGTLVKN